MSTRTAVVPMSKLGLRVRPFLGPQLLDPRLHYVTSVDTKLAEKFGEVIALNALRRQRKEQKFRRTQLD